MSTISVGSLRSVSYLDVDSLGARTVNLMPLWDGKRWHLWIQGPDGLIDMRPADAIHVDYVAMTKAHDNDVFIPFVDFMWQRASWPEACPLITAIADDFHNMGTSVAKLRLFFRSRDPLDQDLASRFAATECEYLIILARTVFDLLQELVACIWQKHVQLKDPAAERRKRERALPDTFSKLVLEAKRSLKTAAQIEEQYGLPTALAEEYAKHAHFFADLRGVRDRIVHGGNSLGRIFYTERGFCVHPGTKPFDSFGGWQPSHRYNENLVSLLPWLAHIIAGTITACTALVASLASVIVFPPEIAPGYRVFVRSPTTRHLFELLQVHDGGDPWWGPPNPDTTTAQPS